MFDPSDPRAGLGGGDTSELRTSVGYAAADYLRFDKISPVEEEGMITWWVRGQNAILGYSRIAKPARFWRHGQADEWMLLLPDATTSGLVSVAGQVVEVDGYSLVIVPPGDVEVELTGVGSVIRLFTCRSRDLAERAANAASYRVAHHDVKPFVPWPEPVDGYHIRSYGLDVPRQDGRFGRIWRCSTLMVNYLEPTIGPRDTTKMSPHSHPDFEQMSLALAGDWVHHLRWPWGTDLAHWRTDEHERCPAPSVAVIPPPAIHTSQAVSSEVNQLVDIFCPPRIDFSAQQGWILNADDYPLPGALPGQRGGD